MLTTSKIFGTATGCGPELSYPGTVGLSELKTFRISN